MRADAGIRSRGAGTEVASVTGVDTSAISRLLQEGVTLTPLFGSEERLLARGARGIPGEAPSASAANLARFYHVEAPLEEMADLAETLRAEAVVEAVYIKPPAEPPIAPPIDASTRSLEASPSTFLADAPPVTPDFTASQSYLGAAPGGIEALWAHTQAGGRGQGMRVIDIEGAWRFTHEDLTEVQGGVVGGVQSSDLGWRDHGTAVIGVFGGDENTFGVVGISPQSNTRAISIFSTSGGSTAGQGSAKAIKDAADLLSAGDIILIELHRPGPRHNFQQRQDQAGYIAIEWWEDDFAAIKYATDKGVIVVEAAGNGGENLDDAIYAIRPAWFPASWTNPFNRANRDSGAILVGAGAPPPGTHGRDHGPDRSRLAFSNYGSSLDAQGWGREVTTTGYGFLQAGNDEDLWYTDRFSGTSSASPVVVGAIACTQGRRKALGQPLHTPAQMRHRLRSTGSPQQDAPGRPATQRIGTRPNLKQLFPAVAKSVKSENKDFKIEKLELIDKKLEIKEGKPEFDKQVGLDKYFDKLIEKPVEGGLGLLIQRLLGGLGFGPATGHAPSASPAAADAGGVSPNDAPGASEARLEQLESAVVQLTHFIGSALRPDLSHGALRQEPDVGGAEDPSSRKAIPDAVNLKLEKQHGIKDVKDFKDSSERIDKWFRETKPEIDKHSTYDVRVDPRLHELVQRLIVEHQLGALEQGRRPGGVGSSGALESISARLAEMESAIVQIARSLARLGGAEPQA
ncbi:MAG TPA: S8 family peptidase [Phycisphaerales bacterium]|nr:S8 family peptidase [Phycisphaerales bacterium]HMP37470.1 S8 family peptidase [Phycisphaerales bacterium]